MADTTVHVQVTPSRPRRGFLTGILATLVMVAIIAILRFTTDVESLPEIVAEGLVGLMPAVVFSTILDRLQKAAQPILYVGILAGMLGVGGLLGRGFAFGPPTWSRALKLALVVWAVLGIVIMPLLGVGLFGSMLRGRLIVLAVEQAIVCGGFGAALVLISRMLDPWAIASPTETTAADDLVARRQRRTALAGILGGLVVIAVGGAAWRALMNAALAPSAAPASATGSAAAGGTASSAGSAAPAPAVSGAGAVAAPPLSAGSAAASASASGTGAAVTGPRAVPSLDAPAVPMTVAPGAANPAPFNVDGLVTEVLNAKDFYTVSKNIIDPDVNLAGWSLKIDGLVDHPATYLLDDIKGLPVFSDYYTLECISNEVGGDLWGNAHWTGVRLVEILSRAGLQAGIRKVVFHAEDGYTDSIPLDVALRPDTLLAYEMNGEPLTRVHGYPARMLIPGIYGMKNVKWINQIELVNYDFKGYWAQRGWADNAPYQISTRIDVPQSRANEPTGRVTFAGVTFAGARGIDTVEVSLDDGKTWQPATIKPSLSLNAWNLWLFDTNLAPGTYIVKARATDGTGAVQPITEQDPVPEGATGYHTILVRVS
jgi:DMSO/TMAO reductase YedYZ molybdopterin-dependent catalytic subunit